MSVSVRVSVCLSVRAIISSGELHVRSSPSFFARVTYGREGWMRARLQMRANRVTDKHL